MKNKVLLGFGLTLSCLGVALGGIFGMYDLSDAVRVYADDSSSSAAPAYKVDFFDYAGASPYLANNGFDVITYDVGDSASVWIPLDDTDVCIFLAGVVLDSNNLPLQWRWYRVYDDNDDVYNNFVTQYLRSYTPFAFWSTHVSSSSYDCYSIGSAELKWYYPGHIPETGNFTPSNTFVVDFLDRSCVGAYANVESARVVRVSNSSVQDGEYVLNEFLRLDGDAQRYYYSDGYGDGANYGAGSLVASAYNEGYSEGRSLGYDQGYNEGYQDGADLDVVGGLFGAVVDVPLQVIRGLTPLVIWDTPIVGIIVTFMFIGLMLWIVKRFI